MDRRIAPVAAVFAMALAAPLAAQDREPAHGHHAATPVPEGHDHASAGDGPDHAGHLAHDDNQVPRTPVLLPGYGNGGFAVTSAVPEARAFFANGMELGAAFAHKAAIAAMQQAERLDPACAMCAWGEALVAGPTINYGKDEKERVPLAALVAKARTLAARAGTTRERALIDALALRYRPGKPVQRDRAYADAMARVAAEWPLDNEIAVLAADAEMVAAFGESSGDVDDSSARKIEPVVKALEKVLARAPDHTPAIHFYIHATETVDRPALAEPYADRLGGLAPRASHLVHMPSHTYYWVGRYQDAADANLRAVAIGEDNARRLGMGPPDGVWGLPYHAHNVIFGLGGAMMAGDGRTALALARPLVERAQGRDKAEPASQLLSASGYFALARFDPAAVDALPAPRTPYLQAAWHYARGEAAAWRGDWDAVRAEREAIPARIATPGADGRFAHDDRAPEQMLAIVRAVLAGRAAMGERRFGEAAAAFREAAGVEETADFRQFSDPPAFWYPVRRDLAAALLAAGDAAGARDEARASLRLRPRDAVAEATLREAEAGSGGK